MTNLIALGEIQTPTQANPMIKQMRSIITKFHHNDPRNLSNQLFFQQQLLYAQMLEGSSVEQMHVNIEFKRVVSEIYTFVIAAQVKYCKMDMRHPFLEQTFLNIAIFNRSMKKYADALMMWKRLEALQTDLYGDKAITHLYTWKNIGTCYLGIGKSEDARKYFLDCIELVGSLKQDNVKPEFIRKDQEEIANLNQNLYLTYISDRDYEAAIRVTDVSLDIISKIYGPRSKRVASKWY